MVEPSRVKVRVWGWWGWLGVGVGVGSWVSLLSVPLTKTEVRG